MNYELKADLFGRLVFSGENDKILEMIDSGVDLDKADINGLTPLMMAIEGDQPKTLELLLKNGANPNKQSELDGFTPLHWAVDCAIDGMIQNNKSEPYPEPIECIRTLLKYGADLNIKNNSGKTAFDLYPNLKEIFTKAGIA